MSERRASAEQRGTLRRPEPSPRACRLPGATHGLRSGQLLSQARDGWAPPRPWEPELG